MVLITPASKPTGGGWAGGRLYCGPAGGAWAAASWRCTPVPSTIRGEDAFKRNDRYREPREHLQRILTDHNRPTVTPHSFRVTFNNRLRDLDVKIEDRQILLAHSSSETTKIYTHPNIERAREYLNRLSNPFEGHSEY